MRLFRLLKNDLAKESAEWVHEGIITEQQAQAICARYGADYDSGTASSLGYRVLVGFGYLFIGLALITLIGANWDQIPREIRMAGCLISTVAVQLLGLRQYLQNRPATATAWFFLGNLFYGASIILIAQIYHLGEHMPDGVLWWALGSWPFALLTQSRLLGITSLGLSLIWFFLEIDLEFYPTLFPLFVLAAAYILYRAETSVALFLMTFVSLGLCLEYGLAYLWREDFYYLFLPEHLFVTSSFFLAAYAFSQWLEKLSDHRAKDYGTFLSVWCLRFSLFSLLIMSYEEPWRWLLENQWKHPDDLLIVVALFSIMAIGFAAQAQQLHSTSVRIGIHAGIIIWVLFWGTPEQALFFQVITNLITVALAILLIVNGLRKGISHYYLLGVLTLLITAFLRYIDLVGNYIGGAILFLVFAAIMLSAAKYWQKTNLRAANE